MAYLVTILICLLSIATPCFATTYYVDNDGSGDDSNAGTDIGAPWATIGKANTTLVAGDTVYIRGSIDSGSPQVYNVTSSTDGICPSNSGTSNVAKITYAVYSGEYIELRGDADVDSNSYGINLTYKSWIKVTGTQAYGLKITKCYAGIVIGPISSSPATSRSESNEIEYAWIGFNANSTWNINTNHSVARMGVRYNWIHHCKFEEIGYIGPSAVGGALTIGMDTVPSNRTGYTDECHYNVVENCEFLKTGHHSLKTLGKWNIFRNNYSHNEVWYNYDGSDRSYRLDEMNAANDADLNGWNILERNRFGHNGPDYGDDGNSLIKVSYQYGTFRYNAFFNSYTTSSNNSNMFYTLVQDMTPNYNYIFNNTYFHDQNGRRVYRFPNGVVGNVIKNNLHWETYSSVSNGIDYDAGTWATFATNNTVTKNFNDYVDVASTQDPLFIDETLNDYDSWTLPNLNLKSSSPAIGQGIYLTQADGASNGDGTPSTALTVDDARYFQDGKFGSASGCDPTQWPAGVSIQADWVCVGTVNNCAQISAINYTTNAITLASAISWSDNANIWPYKISDGTRVLYGDAPEPGAYEYNGEPDITNPIPYYTLVCTGPTQSVTLGVSTSGDATCLYSPVDMGFYDMSNYGSGVTFTTTGGTSHSGVTTLASNASYTFYAACVDSSSGATNPTATSWTFSIGACGSPPVGPVYFSVGGGDKTMGVGSGSFTVNLQ